MIPYQTDWQVAEQAEGRLRRGDDFYQIVEQQLMNDTQIEIRWNGSGKVQKLQNVAANQFIRIREGVPAPEKVLSKKLTFKHSHAHEMPVCVPVAKASM